MKIFKRFLVITFFMFSLMIFFPKEVAAIQTIEIKQGAVFRINTTANISFISDTAGTYYYQVTNSSTKPDNIIETGTIGGNISANTLTSFSLTGLSYGKKYVHIVVYDENGGNKYLLIELPYNFYYSDNFETYNENAYPNNFTVKYDGTGIANQKVITTTQLDGSTGKVFSLNGASSWASDQRVYFNENLSGLIIYEADLKTVSADAGGITIGQNPVSWTGSIVRLYFNNGRIRIWYR